LLRFQEEVDMGFMLPGYAKRNRAENIKSMMVVFSAS
jgi:hypothetical protein